MHSILRQDEYPPKAIAIVIGWLCVLCFLSIAGCSVFRKARDRELPDKSSKATIPNELAIGNEARRRFPFFQTGLAKTKVNRQPSHYRNWRPDLSVLPYANIGSERIKIYNIRNCEYRTEEDYDVRHFDREIALNDVQSVDFVVVPFQNAPLLAHTMLSFGLADGEHIVISVEARLEQGEGYSPLAGALGDFELIYIVGTERDLIRLRTEVRKVDVYLYQIRATSEQVQRLFVSMLGRVNQLAREPEFYDVLSNNCTTNIVYHINQLRPGAIPNDIRVILPGHSDRLAYDLGLLALEGPFEQIRQASKINLAARLYSDSPDFSAKIRNLD